MKAATDKEAFGFFDGDRIKASDPIVTKKRCGRPPKSLLSQQGARPLRDSMDPNGVRDVDPTPMPAVDDILVAVLRELRRGDPIDQRRVLEASRVMLGLTDDGERTYNGWNDGGRERAATREERRGG